MNQKDTQELKELIEFLKENGIGEFDLERGSDLKVRIKFAQETSSADLAMARLLATQQHATLLAILPEVYAASQAAAHGAPKTPAAEQAREREW